MTFYTATTKSLDSIIVDWHSRLIATLAWEDGDPGLTDGKVLHHLTETNIYVWFHRAVVRNDINSFVHGIMIDVSSEWDSVSHEPSGTIQRTMIPLRANWGDIANENLTVDIWEWNDANCILAMLKNVISSGYEDISCFFVMERIAEKEYPDTYSNFYFISIPNCHSLAVDPSPAANAFREKVMGAIEGQLGEYLNRFLYAPPEYKMRSLCLHPYGTLYSTKYDRYRYRNYTTHNIWARKSTGNTKVYFQFPFYHNTVELNIPIAKTKRWFFVDPGEGIADGDIIQWIDGAITREYIYKSVDSMDYTRKIDVAFGYSNMP
jgi:hypothetical protein